MNIAENILKHSLKNVYFLVGTACGGKTTMAKEISNKYGFIRFSDNWNEENHKVWQSIINEKYQPNSTTRKAIDWEVYFSRSVEEFLADKYERANDAHGEAEHLQFSIIELIKLSQNNKVIADVWIEDFDFLLEISDRSRIACLLAPGELIIRDYYQREDHMDFANNPENPYKELNDDICFQNFTILSNMKILVSWLHSVARKKPRCVGVATSSHPHLTPRLFRACIQIRLPVS